MNPLVRIALQAELAENCKIVKVRRGWLPHTSFRYAAAQRGLVGARGASCPVLASSCARLRLALPWCSLGRAVGRQHGAAIAAISGGLPRGQRARGGGGGRLPANSSRSSQRSPTLPEARARLLLRCRRHCPRLSLPCTCRRRMGARFCWPAPAASCLPRMPTASIWAATCGRAT